MPKTEKLTHENNSKPYLRPEAATTKKGDNFDIGFKTGAIYGAYLWFKDRIHDSKKVPDNWEEWTKFWEKSISDYINKHKNKENYIFGYLKGYEHMLIKIAETITDMDKQLNIKLHEMIGIIKKFIIKQTNFENVFFVPPHEVLTTCTKQVNNLMTEEAKARKRETQENRTISTTSVKPESLSVSDAAFLLFTLQKPFVGYKLSGPS